MSEKNNEVQNSPVQFNPEDFINEDSNEMDYIKENLISLDTKRLDSFRFDDKLFKEGIDSVSKVCGAITAMVNVGLTPSLALQYVSQTEGTQVAVEMNKLNAETAIQTAKFADVNNQKNSI